MGFSPGHTYGTRGLSSRFLMERDPAVNSLLDRAIGALGVKAKNGYTCAAPCNFGGSRDFWIYQILVNWFDGKMLLKS